jgi:hypothetical protein
MRVPSALLFLFHALSIAGQEAQTPGPPMAPPTATEPAKAAGPREMTVSKVPS